MRLLENIPQAGQRFLNGIHVSRPFECQLKMTNVQGKTTENAGKIRELIHEDRRRTIHKLEDPLGSVTEFARRSYEKNSNMHRIAAKFVPRFLPNNQKQRRVNVS
jgi:hypothetical protein